MPSIKRAGVLVNPLATVSQLEYSPSQADGVPSDLETSAIYAGAKLTQAAGVLLRLPQDTIAQAVVIFTRFWVGNNGGSLRERDAKDVSTASLYLVTKLSAWPKSPRSIINVIAYLLNSIQFETNGAATSDPEAYYVSEGTLQNLRSELFTLEAIVLRTIGFQTHVALPHDLCVNYLKTLAVLDHESGNALANRAFAHLNTALLSPQLLYLTHQPTALATAAIYLAAREVGVKLPEADWWEVFDVDREELGFLVVALLSMEGFAQQEAARWDGSKVPLTADQTDKYISG